MAISFATEECVRIFKNYKYEDNAEKILTLMLLIDTFEVSDLNFHQDTYDTLFDLKKLLRHEYGVALANKNLDAIFDAVESID